MARFADREKAIKLRLEEKSYSQIKKILGISKSTLSYWLRDYPLSKQRIRELRDCNEQRIERFRETMRKKREMRLKEIYNEQKRIWLPLTKREKFFAGLFLYWGEGHKDLRGPVGVSNTDPDIIRFILYWLTKILKVPREKIKIALHLYKDMDIQKEHLFWSKILNLPLSQFRKPYIKKSSSLRINHKGKFGHGTCRIYICDVRLGEKIMLLIKAIAERYK
ncbi:helix-turn-helix domain-containing protein [Patescibacteria group bacterium]|nr:helix-turn-helix domain-containing protein [Patescibacteria group bacterium]